MADIDEFWDKLINQASFHQNQTILFSHYSGNDLDKAINRVFDLNAMQGVKITREVQGPDMLYVLSFPHQGALGQIRRSSTDDGARMFYTEVLCFGCTGFLCF